MLGAGLLGSRCLKQGLEGERLQVATPPGPLSCLHLGEVQPQDDLSRASKPALLKLYCEQDSPGIWRF